MSILKKKFFSISLLVIILSLAGILLSYRSIDVPSGYTSDEGSFGYNGVLLARTARDQNDRFLPIFVLSSAKNDWRQPVTQYYMALFFKIFGFSVFNFRFSSVIVALISSGLLYLLVNKLLGKGGAFFAVIVFLLTPLIMIQSHLGLDNIMPVPFGILWLFCLFLFSKSDKKRFLFLSAVSLGISFYSYKGMRAVVPVWYFLTLIYLVYSLLPRKSNFLIKLIRNAGIFSLAILPFFAIIPFLETSYAGAVFANQQFTLDNVYDYLYPYFSSFDPTFLFIKGDATLYHSTGRHGMFLLATAPLFFLGCYLSIKKRGFWLLILTAFFSAPFLYGFVNSVHRASRLMVIIPFYVLLAVLGASWLWQKKDWLKGKLLLMAVILLMFFNYYDFVNFYWFTYPKFTENLFGNFHNDCYKSYEVFAKEANEKSLVPYISQDIYDSNGDSGRFFESIYFKTPPLKISSELLPPSGSILLTNRFEIQGMERLGKTLKYYYIQTR